MGKDRKNWCFTFHINSQSVDGCEVEAQALADRFSNSDIIINYYSFGLEFGSQNTPHFQGYIQFDRPITLPSLKKAFGDHIHWEVQQAPLAQQADDYTRKEGGPHWQAGEMTSRGDRTDLKKISEDLVQGKTSLRKLAQTQPMTILQYGKKFRDLLAYTQPEVRTKLTVTVINSSQISKYEDDDTYTYVGSWAGYDGQKTVIIFYDDRINLDALRMKYPYVQCGYERIPFRGENIFILHKKEDGTY